MKIKAVRGVVVEGKILKPGDTMNVDPKVGTYVCRIGKCIPANEGAKRDMEAVESKSMKNNLVAGNSNKKNK